MNTKPTTALSRILMITLVFAMMFTITGAKPALVSEKQASYIVQATSTDLAARLVAAHGGQITSRLDIIHGVAANLSNQAVASLKAEKGIVAVTPNGAIKSSGAEQADASINPANNGNGIPSTDYPDVVGANLVWAQGVTGAGVTVAVLDTGIANVSQFKKGTGNGDRIVAWNDFIDSKKNIKDPNGHGTHVAGIIANGQLGKDGEFNGMAPDVNLAIVRVLDDQGAGTYETVIAGLQWVVENKATYNIRVVNMSLVSASVAPYWADPLDEAVTAAWAKGLVVITAAGNSGPNPMTISVPGNNPYAITVGAFTDNFTPSNWDDDYIPDFSAAGPTLDGFTKPDLVAPGGHIVSTVKQNSVLASEYPDNQVKSDYFKLAGTSQAAAVVSGIAALAISKNPSLTPDQVKMRLTYTAQPWVDASGNPGLYSMWQQGAGRANAYDAVFSTVTESANQGMDIQADLAGTQHYEGYAYYDDATQTFRLNDPFGGWSDGYATWSGAKGTWSGAHGSWSSDFGAWTGAKGTWSGAKGTWSGAKGTWSGAKGTWSGEFLTWSGAKGTWSGGYTSWSGGYGTWSGAKGTWSGAKGTWSGAKGTWSGYEPWAGSTLSDATFTQNFATGVSPSSTISPATISVYLLNQ